jgi:hypothetical protein
MGAPGIAGEPALPSYVGFGLLNRLARVTVTLLDGVTGRWGQSRRSQRHKGDRNPME